MAKRKMSTFRQASLGLALLGCAWSTTSWAQSYVENPRPGSIQSGISLVSGWKCRGGSITVQFDDWPPELASYGTSRPDTQGICGDTDNGFGDLFNFNRLGDGVHTVRLFDNGQVFATSSFVVQTLGQEFLQLNAMPVATIRGFPSANKHIGLQWEDGKQDFTIAYFGIATQLVDLLGSWDLTSLTDGVTTHNRYALQVIQGATSDTPLIVGRDLDHGHPVVGARIDDFPLPPDINLRAIPFDFALLDVDTDVCRIFLFNKTGVNRVGGTEGQLRVVGNSCASQDGAVALAMQGIRTGFATNNATAAEGDQAESSSAEAAPLSDDIEIAAGQSGDVAAVSAEVTQRLLERLRTLDR
jgi:hypothetical protein